MTARRFAEGTGVPVERSRGEIARPTDAEVREQYRHLYAPQVDWRAKLESEWRRRWRANVLLLKAKLEFADSDASTVARELMPYALLRDGRTLEEAIVAGDKSLPLLAARAS